VGCKPVRVVVAVDETDAQDGHARALPAAELPALAQRYAAKVSSMCRPVPPPSALVHAMSEDSGCGLFNHVQDLDSPQADRRVALLPHCV
jgi:hypothetical protein